MCRHSRWLRRLCLGVALVPGAAQAQAHRPSPTEIGEIVDAALQAVLPPDTELTTHTVAERGIRFDYGRTMAAFGHADSADARTRPALTRAVTEGSAALLEDCDPLGTQACARLGRSAYVHVEPSAVSSTDAVVWVHVTWATTLSGRSFRSASGTEVILRRTGSGPWTFVRTGRGVIS